MKLNAFFAFLLLATLSDAAEGKNIPNDIKIVYDPDMFRNVSTLISSKGYPVEEYTVQTSDGFLLSMQRIPHGNQGHFNEGTKQVVFMQHGLISASSQWVLNFPEQSLGFVLADAGYDVWMGNTRGNTYSRNHAKYTPSMREFWNFSFDEMAEYDLPALIDYVLNATGQDQLYYIGHSQGTTSAFALLSENPLYNKKIKLFIALAPVTTAGYMTSVIRYLAPFTSEIDFLFKILGVNEFLPSNAVMKFLSELVCDTEERYLCEDVMFLVMGTDKYQLNQTRLGVYSAHIPAGSSTKSFVHYAQMVNSERFCKYDYGEKKNQEYYNQATPPEYNLSNITTPVAIVWSMNDKLADPADVGLLEGKLKTLVSSYCVPFAPFNHGDYILAVDAHKLYFDQVLSLLAHH